MTEVKKITEGIKGAIKCPYCSKGKVVVYKNAHGQTSQGCSKCGNYFVADYDQMTAIPTASIKGAVKMVVNG